MTGIEPESIVVYEALTPNLARPTCDPRAMILTGLAQSTGARMGVDAAGARQIGQVRICRPENFPRSFMLASAWGHPVRT